MDCLVGLDKHKKLHNLKCIFFMPKLKGMDVSMILEEIKSKLNSKNASYCTFHGLLPHNLLSKNVTIRIDYKKYNFICCSLWV